MDRGFRDVESYLIQKGYTVKMPKFIEKKTIGQLTTAQANSSRLVTACRYPVETRNGHMKSIWHFFDRTLTSFDLPYVMTDYRIGASLINKFFVTMESNRYDADTIARSMLEKNCSQNELAVIIDSNKFNNSVKEFVEAEYSDVEDFVFPRLAKSEFRLVSLGNYQPKLALSYIHQQIKISGKFLFYIFPQIRISTLFKDLVKKYRIQIPALVLAIFKSRFREATKHRVYILADQKERRRQGIVSYYCDCQHGRRLVGCCSHVLAFIAYLSYYRFHPNEIKGTAVFLDNFFDQVQPTLQ